MHSSEPQVFHQPFGTEYHQAQHSVSTLFRRVFMIDLAISFSSLTVGGEDRVTVDSLWQRDVIEQTHVGRRVWHGLYFRHRSPPASDASFLVCLSAKSAA